VEKGAEFVIQAKVCGQIGQRGQKVSDVCRDLYKSRDCYTGGDYFVVYLEERGRTAIQERLGVESPV
jgi:hypothetical protein